MNELRLDKLPASLAHHFPLRPDFLMRISIPTDMTLREAERLSSFLESLVMDAEETVGVWPYPAGADPDGDFDPAEIAAASDDFPDMDNPDHDELDEESVITHTELKNDSQPKS